MMGFFAKRFAKELIIQLHNVWVFMRFTDGFICILTIDRLLASFYNRGVAMVQRLSATTNTSAGTCHNFDGVEL